VRIFFIRGALLLILMCVNQLSASGQLIIGHRGASQDAPENSLASYKLALAQGADGFEGDYWLGKDGQVMCLHDADTKRVGGKKLEVTKAPFEELRALDIGSWKGAKWQGEKIPTIDECLEIVPQGKKFFVELKSGPEVVGAIAKALDKSSVSPDQIVFISFKADAIAECKKQMPHIKALWLCGFKPKKNEEPPTPEKVTATLKRIHADGLNAEAAPDYFDAAFIKRLKELGCNEFSVWTVDDPKLAKHYADLGAWSITTNRPGWLREHLNSK
jgi:glycerophosphoryl diester phosphodiesterase